jgi:hypothetical protein
MIEDGFSEIQPNDSSCICMMTSHAEVDRPYPSKVDRSGHSIRNQCINKTPPRKTNSFVSLSSFTTLAWTLPDAKSFIGSHEKNAFMGTPCSGLNSFYRVAALKGDLLLGYAEIVQFRHQLESRC